MMDTIKKFCMKFNMQYEEKAEEQEYRNTKFPIVKDFLYVVFGTLSGVLIPYVVRYFQKEIYPQSYLFIILIIAAGFLLIFRKFFQKHLEWMLVGYVMTLIALFATAFRDLLSGQSSRETFYMGYAFAMVHRILGYGIVQFRYMALLCIFTIAIKFPMIENPDAVLTLIVIALDTVTIGLSYKSERVDRDLFDTLYRSKKDILKFKQLLTQYLPNQMAIFSNDYSSVSYINNAFKRTFKCKNISQVNTSLEKLIIERETLEKSKTLFANFGCKYDPEEPLSLSTFMKKLSKNIDALKDLGNVSFPVVEEETKLESLQVLENISVGEVQNLKQKGSKESQKVPQTVLKGNREASDTRKENGIPDGSETLKSNEKGSSKSNSSDMAYEEGRKRVFKVKIFPLLWDDSEAIAMVMDDITQQRIIMELKIADKNKDLVIAMVSHELRTPLNGMLGLLDIATKNITHFDTLSYLRACRNSGVLLLTMVNSILDLNQIRHKKLKLVITKVSLQDMIKEIKSLFDYSCKLKMLFLDIQVGPGVPQTINTDKSRLSQILINLLGNAFKFTFKGGVTVKVDLERTNPLKLKFSVIDTGIGIKKEDQEKLFKMYGRLEQQDNKINTHGVGLGLTISNTLAYLLNPVDNKGIHVESEVDKGTSFSFCVDSQSLDGSKRNELESGSFDISSVALNEEKDATLLKKIAVHTINNNENFSKMSCSTQNFDSKKHQASSTIDIKNNGYKISRENLESYGPESQRTLLSKDEVLANPKVSPKRATTKNYQVDGEIKELELDLFDLEITSESSKPWCMVVDDNPFNLMVACHLMEERGFKIKTALNGQEAITKAREHQEEGLLFNIILMDCQMPVMDGYEATRILRKMMNAKEITECLIVALTANNRDEEHEKRCQEAGMNGQIAKPLQIEELEKILRRVQAHKAVRNESNSQ